MERCKWANNVSEQYQDYHDNYWGKETHDDHILFMMLVLESFHTGLSWMIIWNKKEAFQEAFDNFNPQLISQYNDDKVEALMNNHKIVRNRRKIVATIKNAQVFLDIQKEFGSFDKYLWSFTDYKVIKNQDDNFVTSSWLSDKISKDLKKRGISYFGTVTCYSYLEAIGVYDNHATYCFKY